jgi:hypothetical protein
MKSFNLTHANGCFAGGAQLALIVVIERRDIHVFVRTVFDLKAACEHRRKGKEKR